MSDERFTWKTEKLQHLDDEVLMVVDNENKEWKGHILNIVDKLNELAEENGKLKKAEKINMEYAEQIVEENHKFRIAKNGLRRENEQLQKENEKLKKQNKFLEEFDGQAKTVANLKEENEQLKSENKKLQCINDQLEERLENSGIGIALKMDCENDE